MSGNSLEIVVFSFNRGKLLRNCVESLRKFMPDVPITVFDDCSNNEDTCSVLEDLCKDGLAKILKSNFSALHEISLTNGGLYKNIQSFVDVYASCSWVLFLQDDTQVVRKFTPRDKALIDLIFSKYPKSAFIYPAFLTYSNLYNYVDQDTVKVDDPSFSFLYDYEFSGYFDVCIAHIDRLRDARFQFVDELVASRSARENFGTMRLMRQPFVAHLPSPPTYRNRSQTWTQRIWERNRTGLYPVDILTDSEARRLFSMQDTFPTAENFLSSESFWGSHPWPYAKLEGAPLLLRALDRIEIELRYWQKQIARWLLQPFNRKRF